MYIQCNSDPTQHTTDSTGSMHSATDSTTDSIIDSTGSTTHSTAGSTKDLYSASNEALVLQFESMNEDELDYGIDFT